MKFIEIHLKNHNLMSDQQHNGLAPGNILKSKRKLIKIEVNKMEDEEKKNE